MFKWSLLLICFCYSVLTSAQVQLSFNPDAGKTYAYVSNTDLTMEMNMMGQEIPIKTNMVWEYNLQVKSKTAGEHAVEFVFKRLSIQFSLPNMSMKIDTKSVNPQASSEEQSMTKAFASMLDKPINMVLASDGSVKSVTGMTALVQSLGNSLPAGDQSTQLTASLLNSLSDENIKKTIEQSYRFYPAQPVKIGDSWTIDMPASISMISAGDMKNTFTLKSVQNNQGTLSIASTVSVGKISDMEVSLSGVQNGEMIIDLKTGLPISSNLSNTMSGNVNVQGNSLKVNLESKTSLSLK